jgi:DNA polymerase
MMGTGEVLRELRRLGATLKRNGDRLTLRAGSRPIPQSLVEQVREAKQDILALFASEEGQTCSHQSEHPTTPSEVSIFKNLPVESRRNPDDLKMLTFSEGVSIFKDAQNAAGDILDFWPYNLSDSEQVSPNDMRIFKDAHSASKVSIFKNGHDFNALQVKMLTTEGVVGTEACPARENRPIARSYETSSSATESYQSLVYCDFETLSRCDIRSAGTHLYAADPTTEVIILTYLADGEFYEWAPGQGFCERLAGFAADEAMTFVCHGSFERLIWQEIMVGRFDFPPIKLGRWRDTTASCAYHRLPLELDRTARTLKLPIQKDDAGKKLVVRLSRIYRKTGVRPEITPEIFARIAAYNHTDVEVLIALDQRLGPLPEQEREVWQHDQDINDDGFQTDLDLVRAIQRPRDQALAEAREDFDRIVNANAVNDDEWIAPTQVDKLRKWLLEQGEALENLQKGTLADVLKTAAPDIRRVLEVRLAFASSSLKKTDAFLAGTDTDGRARGALVYHGAATGRWTGRRLQPQNLPRPLVKTKPDQIESLVAEIKAGNTEALKRRISAPYTVTDLLVSSLRHVVVARPGMVLAVGDFEMIEACVALALAKQHDKCELIRSGKDPYRDMGAEIYALSSEQREVFFAALKDELTPGQEAWRAGGKTGVLSCGFAVSADGLHKKYPWNAMEDCNRIVTTYRTVWAPLVPKLWYNLKKTAHRAVRNPGKECTAACGVQYVFDSCARYPTLICRLLNGKEIYYPEPEMKLDQYGKPAIYFSAVKSRIWRRSAAWHGTLTENVVSALARELLVEAIIRLRAAGYRVVLSVHDEIVVEGADLTKELMEKIMSTPPQWAIDAGIPIAVEAWISPRYRK